MAKMPGTHGKAGPTRPASGQVLQCTNACMHACMKLRTILSLWGVPAAASVPVCLSTVSGSPFEMRLPSQHLLHSLCMCAGCQQQQVSCAARRAPELWRQVPCLCLPLSVCRFLSYLRARSLALPTVRGFTVIAAKARVPRLEGSSWLWSTEPPACFLLEGSRTHNLNNMCHLQLVLAVHTVRSTGCVLHLGKWSAAMCCAANAGLWSQHVDWPMLVVPLLLQALLSENVLYCGRVVCITELLAISCECWVSGLRAHCCQPTRQRGCSPFPALLFGVGSEMLSLWWRVCSSGSG